MRHPAQTQPGRAGRETEQPTTERRDNRLWTAGFVTAMGANFFVFMVFYLLMTTFALYAVERFGAGEGAAGFSSGVYVLGAMVSRMFAGKYLDIVGRRRMLLGALLAFSVAGMLYAPADSLTWLLVVRFVHGAAFGAASTTITAAAQSLIPPHRRAEGTGYFGMGATVATALGPFVALLVIESAGYGWLFATSSACAVSALVLALLLRIPQPLPMPDDLARRWRIRLSDLLDPATLPLAAVVFTTSLLYSGVLSFLSSYGRDNDLAAGASAFFALYAISLFVSRFFVGRLHDRRGDNVVLYPALGAVAIGFVVIAAAPNSFTLAAAGVLMGFGFGTMMSAGQAIAVTNAPANRIGIAISTFFLAADAGLGLGPIPVGMLISALDYRLAYMVLAVGMVGVVVLYSVLHGRTARRGRLQ